MAGELKLPVEAQFKADTHDIQNHLKYLKKQMDDAFDSGKLKNQTAEVNNLLKAMESTAKTAQNLSDEIDRTRDAKIIPTEGLKELERGLQDVRAQMDATEQKAGSLVAEMNGLVEQWGQPIKSSENYRALEEQLEALDIEYGKLIVRHDEYIDKMESLDAQGGAFKEDTARIGQLNEQLATVNSQYEIQIVTLNRLLQAQDSVVQKQQELTKTPAEIPVQLKTDTIQGQAEALQQRVEQTFDKTPILTQTEEVQHLTNAINYASEAVGILSNELTEVQNAKIPTQEYDNLQKELAETERAYDTAMWKMEEFVKRYNENTHIDERKLTLDSTHSETLNAFRAEAEQARLKVEEIKVAMNELVSSDKAFTFDTAGAEDLKIKLGQAMETLSQYVDWYDRIYDKQRAEVEQAEAYNQKLRDIQANAGTINQTIGETLNRLEQIKVELDALNARQRELENADRALGYSEYDDNLIKIAQLQQEQAQLKHGLEEYYAQQVKISQGTEEITRKTVTWKDYVNAVKSTYKDMTNTIKKVGSFVKDTINSFKQIGNAVKNVVNRIKDMVTHTKLFNAMANHSHKPWYKTAWTIAKALIGVRGLYMLIRKVRTAIITGFTNLTKESVQARGQLELLKAKFLQLKNSVGAAIAPLVAQITPMIQRIIDLFTQAFNAVAMFFGALTGKSSVKTAKFLDSSFGVEEDKSSGGKKGETPQEKYDKAVKKAEEKYQKDLAKYNEKVAKAEQKQADADAKLTDSKEKLNKQLQGFDELNNLTTNDLDDSADAYKDYLADIGEPPELEMPNMDDYLDAATGGGAGSKIMFEDTPIGSFFDTMADWLKNMWKLGDLTDLGTLLGTQLKKFLDDIPWQKYQDFAEKLGRALATLINGFIEVDGLGYSIGKTFAEGLNTIIHAVDAFVSSLHWASVGHFIADTFNGFFENIDWDLIYHTVVTGLRGLALAINQFIADFHWDNLSTTIANLINTAIAGVYIFFSKTEFDTLGLRIAEQIIASVQKIDWKKAGEATGAVLQGLLDLVLAMIHYLKEHKEEVKQAFMDFWHGLCEELDFGDVAELMLTALKVALLLKIPAIMTGIGAAILAGLKLGLTASIFSAGSIGGGLKTFLGGLFGKGAVAEATVAGTEVGAAASEGIASGIASGTAGIAGGIGAVFTAAFATLGITGERYYKRTQEQLNPERIETYGKTLEQYEQQYEHSSALIMSQSDELLDKIVGGTVDHVAEYKSAMEMKERADKNAAKTAEDLQKAQDKLTEAEDRFYYLRRKYDYDSTSVSTTEMDDLRLTISATKQDIESLSKAHDDATEAQKAASYAVSELAKSYSTAHKATEDMIQAQEQLANNEITWEEYIERSNKAMAQQADAVKSKEAVNAAIEQQKANNNLIGSYDEYNQKLRETRVEELKYAEGRNHYEEEVTKSAEAVQRRLAYLSEGGNVDLNLRPVIPTEELNKAGYDAGQGMATVFSDTFSATVNNDTIAMNFTPIMTDENGNYLGVMSPDEFDKYCKDVVTGVREDDLNLKMGATFTGANAVQQAVDAAIEVHELHEQYLLEDEEAVERYNHYAKEAENERIQAAIEQQKANNNLVGNYKEYNQQLHDAEIQTRLQNEGMVNTSALVNDTSKSLVDMSFMTQESAKSLADASLNAKRYAEEQANLQMMNNNLIGDYTQYNEKLRETATVMGELDTQLSAGGRRRPSPFDEEFMTETDEGINKLKEVPTALDEVNTALDTFSETAGTTLAESFGTLSETIVTTFSETFTTKFEEFKTTTTETLTLWVTELQTSLSETFLTQTELLMANIILYLQESYATHLEEFRLLAMQMVMDMTLAMQEQWLIDQIQWDLLIYNIIFTMQNALMIYKPLLITDLLTFCNEILTNVMTALGCSGGGGEDGGGHSTKFYDIMVQCLQGFIDAVTEKGPEALEVIGEFCGEAAGYFESIGAAALGAVDSVKAAMTALANMDMGDLSALGGGKFSISSGGFNFKVGGFANGTVIPPNAQKFLGVLGDNNRETEVISPLSTMTQAMTQALANAGFNNGGNNGDVVVNVDGYELFRIMRNQNDRFKTSTGMSAF